MNLKRFFLTMSILALILSSCDRFNLSENEWKKVYDVDDASPSDLSDDKEITWYSLMSAQNSGLSENIHFLITGTDITASVPYGTDVTKLVASFTTTGTRVTIQEAVQQTGVTVNDFSAPLVYVITAVDGSTKEFTVKLTVLADNRCELLTLEVLKADNPALAADLLFTKSGTDFTATAPSGTDVTSLKVTFTIDGKKVVSGSTELVSGAQTLDFSKVLSLEVIAQDLTTKKTFTVTLSVQTPDSRDLTTFVLQKALNPVLSADVIFASDDTGTWRASVPYGTAVHALKATFTHTGEKVTVNSIAQISGASTVNMTNPLEYVVVALNGTTKSYIITLIVLEAELMTLTDFKFEALKNSFAADSQCSINEPLMTVSGTVPYTSSLTALIPTFVTTGVSVSVNGTKITSGVSQINFTNAVEFVVTGTYNSTKTYTVSIQKSQNNDTSMSQFVFALNNSQLPAAVQCTINADHTITGTVPFGVNRASLIPTFTLAEGAILRDGSTILNSATNELNFTTSKQLVVTAQNGTTTQTYTVTIQEADPLYTHGTLKTVPMNKRSFSTVVTSPDGSKVAVTERVNTISYVYYSRNHGETWTMVETGVMDNDLAFLDNERLAVSGDSNYLNVITLSDGNQANLSSTYSWKTCAAKGNRVLGGRNTGMDLVVFPYTYTYPNWAVETITNFFNENVPPTDMCFDGTTVTVAAGGSLYYGAYTAQPLERYSVSADITTIRSLRVSNDGSLYMAYGWNNTTSSNCLLKGTTPNTITIAATAPSHNWKAIDFAKQSENRAVAVCYYGGVYTTTDLTNLATWTKTSCPDGNWTDVAMSDDGQYIYAVGNNQYLYKSADYGITWTPVMNIGMIEIRRVAISDDHSEVVIASREDFLYRTTDLGETWSEKVTDTKRDWCDITASAEGDYFYAIHGGGSFSSTIWRSEDQGQSWSQMADSKSWNDIVCDNTGAMVLASYSTSAMKVMLSTNHASSFSQEGNFADNIINSIAMSGDGSVKLLGSGLKYSMYKSGSWTAFAEKISVNGSDTPLFGPTIKVYVSGYGSTMAIIAGVPLFARRFFISHDTGVTWKEVVSGSGISSVGYLQELVMSPDGKRIAAITDTSSADNKKLFTSDDGGVTWTNTTFTDKILSISASRNYKTIMLSFFESPKVLFINN